VHTLSLSVIVTSTEPAWVHHVAGIAANCSRPSEDYRLVDTADRRDEAAVRLVRQIRPMQPPLTCRCDPRHTGAVATCQLTELRDKLAEIVHATPWLMRALIAARDVDAPHWLIGAGAVRTAVWDRLHGYQERTPLADIDLGFYDADDLSEEREREIHVLLQDAVPEETWDVKNQAAVHLWYPKKFGYPVEPLSSSAAAVATWPETATCVALRLRRDDTLLIEAPFGLDDLFGLVHRRNPTRVSIEEYERRLASKRISDRWPRVTVVHDRSVIAG
jgi:uncharacterized protein